MRDIRERPTQQELQVKRERLAKWAKANRWPYTVLCVLAGIGCGYASFRAEGHNRTTYQLCVVGAILSIIMMQVAWHMVKPYSSSYPEK